MDNHRYVSSYFENLSNVFCDVEVNEKMSDNVKEQAKLPEEAKPEEKLVIEEQKSKLEDKKERIVPPKQNEEKKEEVTKEKKNEEKKLEEPKPMKVEDTSEVFETLTAYSYYESGKKWVKVLIPFKGIGQHPKENIEVTFKERSFDVKIRKMNNKNYRFRVIKLQCKINPSQSYFTQKTNDIQVSLSKFKDDDNWYSLFKTMAVCEVDSD